MSNGLLRVLIIVAAYLVCYLMVKIGAYTEHQMTWLLLAFVLSELIVKDKK